MATKVVTILKYVGLFSFVFFTIISCEKEIENIGVGLVNNRYFSNLDTITEVLSENVKIDSVISSGIPQYLLGVYSDNEFGELKGTIVSQLVLPTVGDSYTYGDNVTIDSVLINIPYQSTQEDNYSDGKPKFSIDSVIGNTDQEFKLSVYELETFLNTLDPDDPSKNMIYYSDKVFEKGSPAMYSENFKINPDDTVAYIKRYMPDGITVYDIDTVKQSNVIPTMKLPLDEGLIQQLFVDNAGGPEFSSRDAFNRYFRGVFIEALELAPNGSHLISLSMENSSMSIYYSNDENEGDNAETGTDLNGNGTKGEGIVRVKHQYDFLFGSITANALERDYTISEQSGSDRLYIQGAAGQIEIIDLFAGIDLPGLQESEKLVTGANLMLYVDQNASSHIVPEQLFIYNYTDQSQLTDVMVGGLANIKGYLERDGEGNPYRYNFRITDYISDILNDDDASNLVQLGINVFNPTDAPANIEDTSIKLFNWNPQGVVLYDQNESHGDKRVTLEILFSELNN